MGASKYSARDTVGKLLDNNKRLFAEAMTDVLRLGFGVDGLSTLDEDIAREFYEALTCGHAQEVSVGNVSDIIEIWLVSLLQDDDREKSSFSPWAAFRKGDIRIGVEQMKSEARRLGIDCKLESYIAGAPPEHIIG